MLTSLLNFLAMHGYAFYVWTSYASVLILLGIQWLLPWQQLQKFLASTLTHE